MDVVLVILFVLFDFVRNLSALNVIAIGVVVIAIVLISGHSQWYAQGAQLQEILETLQSIDETLTLQRLDDRDDDADVPAELRGWERGPPADPAIHKGPSRRGTPPTRA
jgi:hypothetical protein